MTRRQCFAALVAGVLGVSAAIRPPQYSMSEFPSPGLANGQIEIGDIITFGTMPHFVGIENKKFRAVRFYEHSITLEMVNSWTDLKLHPQGFSFMSPAIDAQEFIEDLRDVRAMESYNSHNLCESHAECSCGWKGETWIGADMSAPRMDGERHRYHQEKPNEHRVWTRSEWTAVGAPAEQEPSNEP